MRRWFGASSLGVKELAERHAFVQAVSKDLLHELRTDAVFAGDAVKRFVHDFHPDLAHGAVQGN